MAGLEYVTVPVVVGFDLDKPVGELKILKSALPPLPELSFAIGYRVLEQLWDGTTRKWELVCVSPVSTPGVKT